MKIYAGNLPYSVKDKALRELFAKYGVVKSAQVVLDKFSGQTKGFGFVDMPDKEEGAKAIVALNGYDFQGRTLRVNESRPDKPRKQQASRNSNKQW